MSSTTFSQSLNGPSGLVVLAAVAGLFIVALLWIQDRQFKRAAREWFDLADRFRASVGEVSGVRRHRTGNRVTWVLTPDTSLPPSDRATRQHQFNVDAADAGRLLEGFEYRLDLQDPVERWLTFVGERVPSAGTETLVSAVGTASEFTGYAFPALVEASRAACISLARDYDRRTRLTRVADRSGRQPDRATET